MTPIKFAIVGGGPSAFYVASRLLQLLPVTHLLGRALRVHVYDRLWAPHGLVRFGVAPDHPEVKNCTHKFDEAAQDSRLSFFGNVNISSVPSPVQHAVNVPLASLYPHYTHIVLASGCTVSRLHPALPPSPTCVPALNIVHWYTQHPSNVPPPPLENIENVSIIGHGNVSLDVARILLTPVKQLEKYDLPTPVLDKLSQSKVKHVNIIGRRGPLEASFTTKELREMMKLPDSAMLPLSTNIFSDIEGTKLTRQQTRILDLLKQGSQNTYGTVEKSWALHFFRSPTGISRAPESLEYSTRLSLAHTILDKDRKAVASGESSAVDTDLVITSLGYRAEPTHEWYEPALGHIRNLNGRVSDVQGKVIKNMYTSGWAATGAKGVLATTMLNAHTLVDTIICDLQSPSESTNKPDTVCVPSPSIAANVPFETVLNPVPDMESVPNELVEALNGGLVTTYKDWKRIDIEEVKRGQWLSKERERMNWDEAHALLSRS